eukprot:gene17214-23725_t
MISDEELKLSIDEILESSDLDQITVRLVMVKLREKHQLSDKLSDEAESDFVTQKKSFIKASIDDFISSKLVEDVLDNAQEVTATTSATPIKKKSGFTKVLQLSHELAEFLGSEQLSRGDAMKLIWNYIKEHDLQNPKDKREILCDEKLEGLFKRKKINMFKMTQKIATMMKSTADLTVSSLVDIDNTDSITEKSSKILKTTGRLKRKDLIDTLVEDSKSSSSNKRSNNSTEDKISIKKQKTTGFSKLSHVNSDLAELIGVPEREKRTEVVSKLWVYIKEKNLQNPSNKREIIFDEPLSRIFKTSK